MTGRRAAWQVLIRPGGSSTRQPETAARHGAQVQLLNEQVPKLNEQTERMIEQLGEQMAEAMEDLFNLLHQGDPRFTDKASMDPEYELNLVVFLDLADTDEFKALYEETRYDEYSTAFAMLTMEDFVKAAFEAVSEMREQIKNARSQQDQAMQDLANAVDEAMGGGTDPGALKQALQAQADAEAALAAAIQAGQAAQQQAVEQLARHGVAETVIADVVAVLERKWFW
jgi:hypothetical protein